MNEVIESPFVYEEKPEWLVLKLREARRTQREKKLGRTVGKWGGNRVGAGRPRVKLFDYTVGINVSKLQHKMLLEMGNGDLSDGVIALIREYI
tara:strand:+ start:453 stop:731 length:279 start_codon:yes stop_codon:yes gene_type:complete